MLAAPGWLTCHPGAKPGEGTCSFLNRLLHLEQRCAAGVQDDGVVD
jgi:hypothetical protein